MSRPLPPFRKTVKPSSLDAATGQLAARMWRDWVQRYWPRLLVSFLLMALVAGAAGLYPLLIERTYAMFDAHDRQGLTLIPLAIIAVATIKGAAMYAQTVATSAVVMRVLSDMRVAMFRHLLASDLAQLQTAATGTLTSRFIADIDALRNALTRAVTGPVRDVLTVVALVCSMFYLDWVLSLVFFAVYPLAAVPIVNIGKRIRRVARETQGQMGDMTAFLTESLSGARMVKTFGLESYEAARAARAFDTNYKLNMRATRQRSQLDPVMEVLGGVAVAAVIAFAGWRIGNGTSTSGEFSGFIGALLMAAQPVRSIGSLNSALQEGLAAAQRVFDVLDRLPTITDRIEARPLPKGPGAVRIETVRFGYEPETDVLTDFSLDVPPGSTVALVGRSGSGKSTVFNLIPRLYDVRAGRVLVDGLDVRDVTLASLRAAIAVVSQDTILFNDTVRANIAFGRLDADDAAIEAAAQAAAAHGFITKLPQGYDTVVGDRGARLSGGERQRLALARAFLKDAPILLLDEATSALDSESERLVQEALERLTHGRTTLVIAHRLATVRNATRIVVMDGGRIVEQGPHDALMAGNGAYARLCRLQFGEEARAEAVG